MTLVIDVADALPAGYSPTLPPVELLPFVTPVMFGVVMVGAVKVCPFSCAALIATLQLKPALVVHSKAALAPLQLGIANALGEALALDAFVTTVLAAILDIPERGTVAHPGADDAPVETMVCPLEEPAGFSSWTGTVVAALPYVAIASIKKQTIFFIILSPRNAVKNSASEWCRSPDCNTSKRESRVKDDHIPASSKRNRFDVVGKWRRES